VERWAHECSGSRQTSGGHTPEVWRLPLHLVARRSIFPPWKHARHGGRMASYRGHLAFSSALAAGYGGLAAWKLDLDWGPLFLGAGLTALGGLLPDLDSDSGVPVRELFGLAAVAVPALLLPRLGATGLSTEETLVVLSGLYLVIRYGLSALFKRVTVHRGMFHSIPAMLIAGLLVFLLYHSPDLTNRLFLAGGVMLGF